MSRLSTPLFSLIALLAAGTALAGGDAITLYPAYGDARGTVIEGRMVEKHDLADPRAEDGEVHNLVRNVRLLKNDERKGRAVDIEIEGRQWQAKTDSEGYFRQPVGPEAGLAPGWHTVRARSGQASASGEALIVAPTVKLGLISDLDDTILVTEVTHKSHMLRNTFLKNASQRRAVPGMAHLYAGVAAKAGATAPIIYLSASPRQLHASIAEFLRRNDFPPGVLITKRIGHDRDSEPLLDQFAYKTAKIEDILARLPGVRFILVGDDGERDPEIYDWVRQHHPERVEAIWIRHVSPDPKRARPEGQRNVAEVLAEGERSPPQ